MFSRVRTTLLLWNLLIIGVILLAAGTIIYFSQRQSLLANVDSLLAQAVANPPGLLLSNGPSQHSLGQQVPFSLVVDASGHVLADPDKLGVKDVTLPKASGLTIGERLNVGWDQGVRIQTVQPERDLFYLRRTSTGVVQKQVVVRSASPGQNVKYVQMIGTGTIQGQPVRLLVQPVLFDGAATPVHNASATDGAMAPGRGVAIPVPDKVHDAPATGSTVQPLVSIKDVQPNAFLITGVSLVPMEQSLHQTLVALLIGAAAGVLLSLLGSWFLAGRALVPIERAYCRQQEFVADAAHELRTPLTILQTSTHLLNQHRNEPIEAQGHVFDDLHEEIGRLTRLTCDLLDLARSDMGQLNLALGRVDLGQVGQALVRRLSGVAVERQIELKFVGSEGPSIVEADSDRLQQALLVLLDNALKHTAPGGAVTLAVSGSGRSATVEVCDTGEGIPPEILGHVFDRFYRGDAARSRSTGGAGLGLAIAKTLVEAHGGTLTLSSVVGTGTTATIHLPLTAEAPAVGRWSQMRRLFLSISHRF
jgi:signal transduction histidine kinase